MTSREGQTVIGSAGSYPTLPDVAGPEKPNGAPIVYPDWNALTSQKAALLEDYAKISRQLGVRSGRAWVGAALFLALASAAVLVLIPLAVLIKTSWVEGRDRLADIVGSPAFGSAVVHSLELSAAATSSQFRSGSRSL